VKRSSPTIITIIMAGGGTGITITTIIGGAGIITIIITTTTTITITKVVHRGGRGSPPASAGNGGSSLALFRAEVANQAEVVADFREVTHLSGLGLKVRRAAEGNPNWRSSWMEGVHYQSEVSRILRGQFYAARQRWQSLPIKIIQVRLPNASIGC
jgi:hypothetical protein